MSTDPAGGIRIHSTLSRQNEVFEPRDAGKIGIYVCGPTVYDAPHLGHARSVLAFDVIRRYLIWRGFDVLFISNYTDVDDKIIDRAREEGVDFRVVSERYIGVWQEQMGKLGVLAPDITPRATEHIEEMIELIDTLIKEGVAYEAEGGVWFSVDAFQKYGELSGQKVDEMRAGARVEPGEGKRHPLDFALWKTAKEGEPHWMSPWGPGRPGWHIECSAMSLKYLGSGFDLHGGGQDLVFPHHENERAQSEAAGEMFARYWMHNGLVNLEGEKMSKSTGNFVTLAEALAKYSPPVIRLLSLQSHYRHPVDFGAEEIGAAGRAWERLSEFARRAAAYSGGVSGAPDPKFRDAFVEAMDDDFGTPEALAAIFELVREGNQAIDEGLSPEEVGGYLAEFLGLCEVLGLEPGALPEPPPGVAARLVDLLVELREEARAAKDWAVSDRIRDELAEIGVSIEDLATRPKWHWRSDLAR